MDIQEKILQHFNETELLLISFDSEIQAKKNRLIEEEKKYMDGLSLAERRNTRQRAATILANLNEMLSCRPSMSPEELRAKTLESLDSQIKRCEALTRLQALQKILKTTKKPKEIKTLQREERELLKLINECGVALSGFVGPSFEDQALTSTMLHLTKSLEALKEFRNALDSTISLLGLFGTKKAELADNKEAEVASTPDEMLKFES